MRLSRTVITALAVLALGGVTSCDASADADKPSPRITASKGGDKGLADPSPDASPSIPKLTYAKTPNRSTFNVKKTDGTTYEVALSTGKLQRATQWLATGDSKMDYNEAMTSIGKVAVLGEGCGDVNLKASTRDAVVPIKLTIKDTTPEGYVSEPEIVADVYVRDGLLDSQHDVELRQHAHTPDGYVCLVADGADLATPLMATRTGEAGEVETPSWLVLPDYYNSDPAKFKDVKLAFSTLDGDGRAEFTDATGYFSVREERDIMNNVNLYTADVVMNLAAVIAD